MSHQDVSDELLTLLGAGHETDRRRRWAGRSSGCAATPRSWPELVEENDDGGSEYPPGHNR